MKTKICGIIIALTLIFVNVIAVTTLSEEGSEDQIQWPTSWMLIDSDPTENGASDDYRDVQYAYYNVDDEYLYFRLECYASPNFTAEPDGRYKWFIDIDDTHNMGQKGGNVFEAEYMLFVEDSPKPGGDGIGDIYLLNDVNGDGFIGDDWPDYLNTPGKITDSSVASYRIDGNCMDVCVRLTEISNPTNSYFTWSTDQENPNLDQAPDIDRSNNYWDTDLSKADISIVKTDSVDPVYPGDSFTYSLLVTNHGPHITYNINVTDEIPANLVFNSATPSPSGGSLPNLFWDIPMLSIGESYEIFIDVTVSGSFTGVITNTAVANNSTRDPIAGNNQDTEETTVIQTADLSIVKTDSVDPVYPGDSFTYNLHVTNNGIYAAENVVIVDNLPAGVSFVNAIPVPSNISGSTLTWNAASLAVGNSMDISIEVSVDNIASTVVTNNAEVTSDTYDPVSGNNAASETTTIGSAADLSISKSSDSDFLYPGDSLTYTIIVSNNGPDVSTNVNVSDMLPAGVSFVSANPDPSENGGSLYYWNFASLANGGSEIITIDVLVGSSSSGIITNNAEVSSDTYDPVSENNMASKAVAIGNAADLSIEKAASADTVIVGDNLTYLITVTNNGPHAAENVVVSDILPADVTFLSADPVPSGNTGQTYNWNLALLGSGELFVIEINVSADAMGTIINTAQVTSDTHDLLPDNNEDSVETNVRGIADLSIEKTSEFTEPVHANSSIVYYLNVTNHGPDVALNVNVVDVLPDGVTFVDAMPMADEVSGSEYRWVIASMGVGESVIIRVNVTVNDGFSGAITNLAYVEEDSHDPDDDNDEDDDEIEVLPVADISIEKTSEFVAPAHAGSLIAYTLNVTNHGPDLATNVNVTDILPDGVTFVDAMSVADEVNGLEYRWFIPSLIAGESFIIKINVTVNESFYGTITNTATVEDDSYDPDDNNDEDDDEIEVVSVSDLSIEKTSEFTEPLYAGDLVIYYLNVTNHGPDVALDVNVTDMLPNGVTFADSNLLPSGNNGSTYWWIIASMDVDESVIIRVNATVNDGFSGTITNIATVEDDSYDPDDDNDEDDEDVTVDEEEDDDPGPTDPGNNNPGNNLPPQNKDPTAKTDGHYFASVDEEIQFNATESHDNDEDGESIDRYDWKFSDEDEWHNDSGATPTHTYSEPGRYNISLRVFDNEGISNINTTFALIAKLNSPPSQPEATGPQNGTQNVSYNFTVVSIDEDGDEIKYTMDWGDGNTTESDFLPSGTPFNVAYKWKNSGGYKIKITADDNSTITTEDFTIEINEPEPDKQEAEEGNIMLPLILLLLLFLSILLFLLDKRRRDKKKGKQKITKSTAKPKTKQ